MDNVTNRYVTEPHPHDILTSENGKKIQANHIGNVHFLKLLVSDYNDNDNSKFLSAIESTKRVIKKIQSRNPPGRFLKKVEDRDAPSSPQERAASIPKFRWEIMSLKQATSTSLVYFEKVKGEVKRSRQKKKKSLRKRIVSSEQQRPDEAISGEKKKARTASIRSAHGEEERRTEVQNAKQSHFLIESDNDESSSKSIENDNRNWFDPQSHLQESGSPRSRSRSATQNLELGQPMNTVDVTKGIDKPHEHDFLFGNRGKSQLGNIVFYDIVVKHKLEYDEHARRVEHISQEKIYKLQTQYAEQIFKDFASILTLPRGRFLKQDRISKLWYDIGYTKVIMQIKLVLNASARSENELKKADPVPQTGSSLDVAAESLLNNLTQSQLEGQEQTINPVFGSAVNPSVQQFGQKQKIQAMQQNVGQQQHNPHLGGLTNSLNSFTPIAIPQQNDPKANMLTNSMMLNSTAPQAMQIPPILQHPSPQQSSAMSGQANNEMLRTLAQGSLAQGNLAQNPQLPMLTAMSNLTSVQTSGTTTASEINQNTMAIWSKLNAVVSKEIQRLETETFRARQLQEQHANEQSNADELLRLLETHQTQMLQFRQQFQEQQNAEQQREFLQKLQSQFQIQLQQLHVQHRERKIRQQQVHRQEIQAMQKRQQEQAEALRQESIKQQEREEQQQQLQQQRMQQQQQQQLQRQKMQQQQYQHQCQLQMRIQHQHQIQMQQQQIQQHLQHQNRMHYLQRENMKVKQQIVKKTTLVKKRQTARAARNLQKELLRQREVQLFQSQQKILLKSAVKPSGKNSATCTLTNEKDIVYLDGTKVSKDSNTKAKSDQQTVKSKVASEITIAIDEVDTITDPPNPPNLISSKNDKSGYESDSSDGSLVF